jgi:hypothetical protein
MNATIGVSMPTTNIWLDFNEHKSEYDLNLQKTSICLIEVIQIEFPKSVFCRQKLLPNL